MIRIKRKVVITLILIVLVCFVWSLYRRSEKEQYFFGFQPDVLITHGATDLHNQGAITENINVEFNLSELQNYISAQSKRRIKNVIVEQIEFTLSSNNINCLLSVDDPYVEKTIQGFGPRIIWLIDSPKPTETDRIVLDSAARVTFSGSADTPKELSLVFTARIKCRYRGLFLNNHIAWLMSESVCDTINVLP